MKTITNSFFTLILALTGLFLVGCSVDGQITDVTELKSTTVLPFGQLTGIVPGSLQNATTSGGYNISSTIGDPVSAIATTTAGGYTVFSNVQGNIVSQ